MNQLPFVLLHGFAGDGADWDAVRARLGTHRALVEPIYGHRGRTEESHTHFELEVERLLQSIQARNIDHAHLVGYSLGARLALGLLARKPGLFARATLIGASPGLRFESERAERRQSDAAWVALLRTRGLDAFYDAWSMQLLFRSQLRFPDRVTARRQRLRETHDALGLAQALSALGLAEMPNLWDGLGGLRLPVQLVHGSLDHKFADLAEEMLPRMPDAVRRQISDCGHNPLLERPAELAELLTLD